MTTPGTQLALVPNDIQLPDYLRTPDAAEAIAKANQEAGGGIKIGGFPRISIKGGKFHFVDGDTTATLMDPPPAGAPAGTPHTPKMLLRAVIVAANPALSKLYYEGEWTEGEGREPDCSSDDGILPDAHIKTPQHSRCSDCPKNAWGSKISKATGKEVKACADNKNLALLPADDLGFKAAGLTVTPSALSEWGKYVKALSNRNIGVDTVITNIMFDHTASYPKMMFSFGGFLTAEQFAQVKARQQGDDVKAIVKPSRTIVPVLPALPAPAQTQPAAVQAAPAAQPAPVAPVPAAAAPVLTGFGAPAAAPTPPAAAPEAPKRTRAPRKAPEAPQTPAQAVTQAIQSAPVDPLAHVPADVRSTIALMGGPESELGKQILAKYPAPAAVVAPAPLTAPAATAPVAPPAAAPAGFGVPPAAGAPAVGTSTLAAQLKARLAQKAPGA